MSETGTRRAGRGGLGINPKIVDALTIFSGAVRIKASSPAVSFIKRKITPASATGWRSGILSVLSAPRPSRLAMVLLQWLRLVRHYRRIAPDYRPIPQDG